MCAMICSVLSNLRLGPSRARARAPGGRRIRLWQYGDVLEKHHGHLHSAVDHRG